MTLSLLNPFTEKICKRSCLRPIEQCYFYFQIVFFYLTFPSFWYLANIFAILIACLSSLRDTIRIILILGCIFASILNLSNPRAKNQITRHPLDPQLAGYCTILNIPACCNCKREHSAHLQCILEHKRCLVETLINPRMCI